MLTKEKLASIFTFNEGEGRFYWIEGGKGRKRNRQVGSFDAHGYGQINIFGKIWKEHHLVWLWVYGELPPLPIDHINHDRRDNRPENLRLANNIENHKNRPKQKNNKFGVPGISLDKRTQKYHAYINVNKKRITLGLFKELQDAIDARLAANKQYGYHENHGATFGRPKHKELKAMIVALGLDLVPGQISAEQAREIYQMYEAKIKKELP